MNEIINTLKKNLSQARFTYLIVITSILIFLSIHIAEKGTFVSDKTLTKFGAPTAIEIFSGKYWGIVSNSFVHYNFAHLIINLIATLLIASYVERRIGFWKLFAFGLLASLITSAFQVSFSNDAGIGLSGVNYALFGFIFGKTFIDQRFRIVTKNFALIVMTLFIPFCEFMNRTSNWNVATVALVSGLFFGILFAGLFSIFKLISTIILSTMFLFSLITLIYSPWSAEWNCSKGMKLHNETKLVDAKKFYETSLRINPKAKCASDNLTLIKIDELSEKALKLHENEKYIEAGKIYDEILKIDPKNQWAIDNKRRLP
ncbi:MAG: rhomboid family intramembrane serine protease [Bacteroidetes bacterium]|nr:rhomboid family intramembrane serine protease [Bacteroidota bacterium]